MDLDDVDHAILVELQRSGRINNVDLSAKVGLSPSATLRRTKALEHAGVIDRYVAVLDASSVGRGTTVFVDIALDKQSGARLEEFEAAVARCPDVVSCHLMAGQADYLLEVACEDVADYERIHRDWLSALPGVANLHSSFALRTVCRQRPLDLTHHHR